MTAPTLSNLLSPSMIPDLKKKNKLELWLRHLGAEPFPSCLKNALNQNWNHSPLHMSEDWLDRDILTSVSEHILSHYWCLVMVWWLSHCINPPSHPMTAGIDSSKHPNLELGRFLPQLELLPDCLLWTCRNTNLINLSLRQLQPEIK